MKNKVLIAFFVFCVSAMYAQGYEFKVLAQRGDVKILSGSEWKQLPNAIKLSKDNEVKLGEGSYLALIHASGKTKELKTSGTYKVEELSKTINDKSSDFSSKYSKFVIGKMGGDGKSTNYAITGSVERALLGTGPIKLYSPRTVKVNKTTSAVLKWTPYKDDATYVLEVMDLGEDVLKSVTTKETTAEIDLSNIDSEGEDLLVRVKVKGVDSIKSESCMLKVLDKEETQKINGELKLMKQELDMQSAIDNMVLATYFEDHDLVLDAIASYEKALKLEPGVEGYQQAYNNFLSRVDLVEKKK